MVSSTITPEQWANTTFEGHRRDQLREWAKMSFAEKIEWLDEAQDVVDAFEAARKHARPIVSAAAPESRE